MFRHTFTNPAEKNNKIEAAFDPLCRISSHHESPLVNLQKGGSLPDLGRKEDHFRKRKITSANAKK